MADWTANSDFGAIGRREPIFRATREPAAPRDEGVRSERFAATRTYEEEPPLSASAALAEYNAAQDGPLAKARLAVWVGGGVVSLALIAGIGIWGYKLVLREVIGLPVIHAEQGPMRVLPADPGGEVVPQQGLAVNAIPAAGTAAPPSDVLTLAPPTPGLAEEDMEVVQTMAEADEVMPAATAPAPVATDALPPAQAAVPAEAAASPAAPAPAAATGTTPDAASAAAQLASAILSADRPMTTEEILAFADQITAQSAPLTLPAAPAQPAAVPAEPAAPAPTPAVEVAAVAPVAASASVAPTPLRPQPRPAAAPAAAPTQAAPAEATPAEAAPAAQPAAASSVTLTASLPAGTNLIQLGAFDSPEIAASEWTRLQGRFGEFLGSKERVVQETQSGGRTLYRLRALGFADRADARRLCAALTAEGADCIPVTVD